MNSNAGYRNYWEVPDDDSEPLPRDAQGKVIVPTQEHISEACEKVAAVSRRLKDMTGMRFGMLSVVRRGPNNTNGQAMWLCRCDCGVEKVVQGIYLRNGDTSSCGCRRLAMLGNARRIHGACRTRLYRVWSNMLDRCTRPAKHNYHRYGGRGIKVCDEWRKSAEAFLRWALANGYKQGLQIDRRNNDGDYSPDNCRFVTPAENSRNRSRHSNTQRLKREAVESGTHDRWSQS